MNLLSGVALAITLLVFWQISRNYWVKSPLDNLPGPAPVSFFLGNVPEIASSQAWKKWASYAETYGPASMINGFLRMRLLLIHDPRALHSVLVKDQDLYPKRLTPSHVLKVLQGPGIFSVIDKSEHRRQRKLLNPVFSTAHLRDMTDIFYSVVHKMQAAIESRLPEDGTIDMSSWNSRTTLEILGQAGLGYSFDNAADDSLDAFGESLKLFLTRVEEVGLMTLLIEKASIFFSDATLRWILTFIPMRRIRTVLHLSDAIFQRSQEIIADRKRTLREDGSILADHVGQGKDIMSICLKANMAVAENERMSDEEIVSQMATFMIAGMDTTSNALSRILHLLAGNMTVQEKLRAELLEATQNGSIDVAYDDLMKLPYLDAVIRETLRAYSPAPLTSRTAAKDHIIPLSSPVRGRDGSLLSEIIVPKGTLVILHIQASNTNKDLWGDDALAWKPERWLSPLPAEVERSGLPNLYSNLLTFAAGSRSCIGLKFAELEMKVYLCVLLTRFSLHLADQQVVWNSAALMYPTMEKEGAKPEMLLKVKRL
ncbi:cytochrome P450 [Fomes fomentarius]|nr:cytochrome P450 [Fomes fomentarius]